VSWKETWKVIDHNYKRSQYSAYGFIKIVEACSIMAEARNEYSILGRHH
jgi:hypothetical protein